MTSDWITQDTGGGCICSAMDFETERCVVVSADGIGIYASPAEVWMLGDGPVDPVAAFSEGPGRETAIFLAHWFTEEVGRKVRARYAAMRAG